MAAAGFLLLIGMLGESHARTDPSVANGRIVVSKDDAEIWTMEPDGSDQMQLTDWFSFDAEPAWSPDGSQIAFARDMTGQNDYHIFVMNSDGSGQTDLTPDTATSNRHPTWSPDGTKIAFVAVPEDSQRFRLVLMKADGSRARNVPVPVLFPWTPSWTSARNRIVFQDENYFLWSTDLQGNARRLTSGSDENPNASRTGSAIVFQRGTVDGDDWVFTLTPENGVQQITFGPSARDRDPAWSPDGTQIVFHRLGDLWVMNADGSDQVQIGFDGSDYEPDWQPIP